MMTAAYRLKGLGWFGGVVIVSLGFYLVSLRDIRALETEFDVRANLVQLERWNGDILALVAPTAGQFVRDERALASISFDRAGAPGADGVQTAALIVPAMPALQPAVVSDVPAVAPAAPVDTRPAMVQVAATTIAVPRPTVAARITPAIVHAVAAVPVAATRKAKAVAMLDRTLLSDSTLGDLLSGARAETR